MLVWILHKMNSNGPPKFILYNEISLLMNYFFVLGISYMNEKKIFLWNFSLIGFRFNQIQVYTGMLSQYKRYNNRTINC